MNKNNNIYNQYDIDIIDDEYILRHIFHHMDLSDEIHLRYIIYFIILKPNILKELYNGKNIIEILLEEYEIKKEYINQVNKIFAYIKTYNSQIFNIITFFNWFYFLFLRFLLIFK